jgi:ribosome-associated translation inhibitor RaiA
MQIAVNGKQFQIADSRRGHFDESIHGISEKYCSNSINASLTMLRDRASVRADISVHAGWRIMIQGQAQNAGASAAFDFSTAKIDKLLWRFKWRLRNDDHQARDGMEAQEVGLAVAPCTTKVGTMDAAVTEEEVECSRWSLRRWSCA